MFACPCFRPSLSTSVVLVCRVCACIGVLLHPDWPPWVAAQCGVRFFSTGPLLQPSPSLPPTHCLVVRRFLPFSLCAYISFVACGPSAWLHPGPACGKPMVVGARPLPFFFVGGFAVAALSRRPCTAGRVGTTLHPVLSCHMTNCGLFLACRHPTALLPVPLLVSVFGHWEKGVWFPFFFSTPFFSRLALPAFLARRCSNRIAFVAAPLLLSLALSLTHSLHRCCFAG